MLFEVLATLVLLGLQVVLMWRQTQIFDRQASVMEKQTTLLEQQTSIARVSLSPEWTFDSGPDSLRVTNTGKQVRKLEGTCVPFLRLKMPEAVGKNIELEGYFGGTEGFTLHSKNLYFWSQKDAGLELLNALMPYRLKQDQFLYVELRYVNSAGETQMEKFVMDFTGSRIMPGEDRPRMDAKVNLKPYFDRKPIDTAGAAKVLAATIEELKKK